MQYLGSVSKMTEWSQFFSKAKHSIWQQSKSMPQLLMPKKLKLNSSMKTYRFHRTNTKRCPFHHRGLECKSRKSRDTWSNRQVWPWSTEWSRAKLMILLREHTGHSKRLSTTKWHWPRALPVTEQQRHLPSASTEIEPHAAIAVDLQQLWSEALHVPGNPVRQVFR